MTYTCIEKRLLEREAFFAFMSIFSKNDIVFLQNEKKILLL